MKPHNRYGVPNHPKFNTIPLDFPYALIPYLVIITRPALIPGGPMTLQGKVLISLVVAILILSGCSAERKRRAPTEAPDKLYAKALSLYNRGKFETALDDFKDVKNYYPEAAEAVRAEVKVADCHFFLEEYEEAIAFYEEFRKLHPYHEDIPYVLFQIGQAYFKQIKTSDRDPKPARKALLNFQYLVENYPPSVFTAAAKEKTATCRKSLAEHEFLVGRFYYRKSNYQGAVVRFEGIILNYPDADVAPEALFYMGKAYVNLSIDDKAKAVFLEITRLYPSSEFASKAKAILRTKWNETEANMGPENAGGSAGEPL